MISISERKYSRSLMSNFAGAPDPVYLSLAISLFLVFSTVSFAENQETVQAAIESYSDDYSAQAAVFIEDAEQLESAARNATARAVSAKSAEEKRMWHAFSVRRSKLAEQLREEAQFNLRRAEEERARAAAVALEAQPESKVPAVVTEPAEENHALHLGLHHVLGVWRTEKGNPFAIIQEFPDLSSMRHRLQAHTNKRVWQGSYLSSVGPGEPQLIFEYSPTPNEMRSTIPLWARQSVEGRLKWRLKVFAEGTVGSPRLRVEFWPEKIRYSDDGTQTVEIVQTPRSSREFLVEPANELRFEVLHDALVIVRPSFARSNPETSSVPSILKGQLFFVEVVVAPSNARQLGEKISVSVSSGQQSVELELKQGGLRRGRPITYSHVNPIAIDLPHSQTVSGEYDDPILSVPWMLGKYYKNEDRGGRLDLDLDNGSVVTVSFEEAHSSFVLFDTGFQQGLNYYRAALEKYRWFFNAILLSTVDKDFKEIAADRLLKLKNLEILLASESFSDPRKLAIAEFYLRDTGGHHGIVLASESDLEQRVATKSKRLNVNAPLSGDERNGARHPSGLYNGIVWSSRYEMVALHETVTDQYAKLLTAYSDELAIQYSYAGYDILVQQTGTDTLVKLVFGHDHFGNNVNGLERWVSGLEFFSDFVVDVSLTRADQLLKKQLDVGSSAQGTVRRIVDGATNRFVEGATGMHQKRSRPTKLPESVTEVQWQNQLGLRTVPDPSVPVGCAHPRSGAENLPPNPIPLPDLVVSPVLSRIFGKNRSSDLNREELLRMDIVGIEGRYGPSAEVIEWGGGDTQLGGSCQCEALIWITKRAIGRESNSISFVREMIETGVLSGAEARKAERLWIDGFSDYDIGEWAKRVTGAEVRYGSLKENGAIKLGEFDHYMENGWHVKHVLRVPAGEHAVALESLVRDAKGDVTHVRFYDPTFKSVLQLPVSIYDGLFQSVDNYPHFQFFSWEH